MRVRTAAIAAIVAISASSALAGTVYVDGTTGSSAGLTFGDHLIAGDAHASVPGSGGSGISNNGDALNGLRTYTYDLGAATDLADGVANRGDAGFAMLIWDMGSAFNSMRLFTHQDHYSGGPISDAFTAMDVMEYSVWGSNDGDNFVLLSDVTAFDLTGGGAGKPTYTFAGTEAAYVYRGGSAEYGAVNAYTRDYVFGTAYRFYGVRTSSISLAVRDADPELDAVAGFNTPVVPLPPAAWLGFALLGGLGAVGRVRRSRRQA